MNRLLGQAIRFLAVGGVATITDASIFAGLVSLGLDPRVSNMLSYPLSAALAFWLHRGWTFAARDGSASGQAARFVLLVCAGLALSTGIIWVLAPLVGPLSAKTVAIGMTLVLNFTFSRLLVFRHARRRSVAT